MAKLSDLFGRRGEENDPYKSVLPIDVKPDEGNNRGANWPQDFAPAQTQDPPPALAQERAQDQVEESIQESVQEPFREPVREPAQESPQERPKERSAADRQTPDNRIAQPIETFSDAGSRIGEENETLRNLLNDTGRKISELDELKQAFDKLVVPFNSTLRALEQEKSQTLSLSGMLEETRTAYETLRGELYDVEKRSTTAEAEADRLREELEHARESNRTLESTAVSLNDELKTRDAQIAELERQLEQESSQRRSLSETRRTLQEQLDGAERRIMELEGEFAAAREKLTLTEDDKASLQLAVDQGLTEIGRLTRRLTESENTLTATRAQFGKVEASYAEVFGERGRLAAALDEAKEQYQAERNTMSMRLDALTSRAATAERLLADARQNLLARTEEVRAFDRKAVEATIARNSAEKRLAQMEAAHEMRERQVKDLEHARTALSESNHALGKTLKTRESALARAEERIASLTERNAHLEADLQIARTNVEKRVEELSASLQRERMERAMLDGALEAGRRDNGRLQDEVTALRSMLRRSPATDEDALAPSAPANEDLLPPVEPARAVQRGAAGGARVGAPSAGQDGPAGPQRKG